MKYLNLTGLSRVIANLKNWVVSQIPTKTSEITNDSGFITSHQSLSNYSTLDNTVKSISISGKTITVTPGSGSAYTLTTQDTVYTLPTASSTLGGVKTTSTVSDASGYTACPIISGVPYYKDTNTTYTLSSLGIGNVKNYDQSKAIKSITRSGTTFTYTCLDGTTGTFTQQDNNTWTAMVGATSSANGSVGYVNAVPPKDGYNTKYLRADGTWAVPPDHTYTVNNATLTIQKNGTNVATFTSNASSNATANITVPTKVSELDNDSNYLTSVPNLDASKITSGTIDIARLPQGALERLVTVTNKTARFALTASTVQVGDVVKQTDTGVMYYIVDTSELNSEDGYSEFTAGSATSVPWSGVTGKPSSYTPSSHTHGNITNAGAVGTTANKPLITTTNGVITTGSFGTTANTFCQGNDSRLSDARTPTAHTHSASDITSGLATVATSGSYNDLSNKPTIPTVNNATLTIQKNGTTVKTFTANASSNVTANISVPTKTSELTNDSGFITGVSWNDVSNKPTLATVATSGSYNDLDDKPTIPTVNNATLTIQKNGTTVKTFTANASSNVTANITVPTKTSDLTNDSHVSITTETDTTSTGAPTHGGTFTCIDSVTRDSNGHVTTVNTKTVTLPADSNTDTKVTQNVSTANENHPILLSATKDATSNQGAKTSIFASGVKVNPSTNTVTATTFSGALSGNASTATQFSANKSVTLTGDVTGTASSKAGWSVATTLTESGVTAGTYGPSANVTGNNNATISVPEITVDEKGRVTSVVNRTLTCKNNTYSVYNKTLTIQKNGTDVAKFTSNSNTDVTANITVPTKTSELTNNSGFLTSHQSLTNYVTLDGAQTITGDKTFQGYTYISKQSSPSTVTAVDDCSLAFNQQSSLVFFQTRGSSNFKSYNSFLWSGYLNSSTPDRYGRIRLYRSMGIYGDANEWTPDTSFSFIDFAIHYKFVNITDNVQIINDGTANAIKPVTNNATDLGTSGNKWKTLNGINPGALGFPNPSNAISLDTTNWDLTNYTINSYTPPADGWIMLAGYADVIQIDGVMNYGITVNKGYDGYCEAFLPVPKGYVLQCRFRNCTTLNNAKFFPCQGNV